MRNTLIMLFFMIAVKNSATALPLFHDGQRKTYNFNSDWKLKVGDIQGAENLIFDDHDWKPVTLPRPFNEDEAFKVSIEGNYRCSGEVDAMRIPKDAFYAHQAMWDGWVDIEKLRTYIVGHWNYADSVVKDVFVISPADKVELFLNGISLG